MNNYDITFRDLKRISQFLAKGNDEKFIEYINSFYGKNVYEKFKNILKCWENDVSYTLSFNINNNPTKIQLSYIISELGVEDDDRTINSEDITISYGISDKFQRDEILPIYNIIKHLEISGISINMVTLSDSERKDIINNLPAKVFNNIYDILIQDKDRIFKVSNPLLKNFHINFLSNDAYVFLRGLFSNFDEYYFKDVIFHLSKRIDGEILMNSTPLEIEYYMEKYSKEMETEDNSLNL
jgi:hypothetical protein